VAREVHELLQFVDERPIAVLSRARDSDRRGAPDGVDSDGKRELSFQTADPVYRVARELLVCTAPASAGRDMPLP
jgi:hypothetical protein